ncbi:MAG: adenylyl-sulfate kinase [Deltaproteobacteria bacterium]|jgi:adenylyl-sulfate kinase|nr:adenylyl-sulfate kinase [Deltaproteobacteria bacterium]
MHDDPHPRLIAPRSLISKQMREERQNHRGMVFWLTGMSGAGKSTLAHIAEAVLFKQDVNVLVLDGDAVRSGLCRDLGFSVDERRENNRRVAELAKLFAHSGQICICALISPSAAFREEARRIIGEDCFREVFISCSLEECERRDVKGFYKKARQGEIKNYTGISADYEPPCAPDCIIGTDNASEADCADALIRFIRQHSRFSGEAPLHARDPLSCALNLL